MRSSEVCIGAALIGLLSCGAAVSAVFLDEAALAELAEREGYAVTGQLLHRARRQAEECRCPPPPPPPFPSYDGDMLPPPPPPPPPPSGSGSQEDDSEQGGRRPRPPGPPRGCWPPPPPPGPYGPHHHHHPLGDKAYTGPACEFRPLFRVPDKFNMTARIECFGRWERPQARRLGMIPGDYFDVTKFKPMQFKSLMWNKGCGMQCHFMEMDLLTGSDNDLAVDPEAVSALLKEEGDGSDMTAAVNKAVEACMAEGADMLHPKQVCQSAADEILFCLQRTIEETCPGAKWQGQRTCDEVADAGTKLRTCAYARRSMHHHPPPPFMDGRRGPFGPGKFEPAPSRPNVVSADGAMAEKN